MSREAISNHQERWLLTQQFAKGAVSEGAHKPVPRGYNPESWVDAVNLSGIYIWTTASFRDIAKRYNKFPQGVCKSYHLGVKNIWKKSSPGLQERYPWDSLVLAKPMSEALREKYLLSSGGLSVRVKRLVWAGLTGEEICRQLGINGTQLASTRRYLKDQVNVPLINTSLFNARVINRRLKERLSNPGLSDQEVKEELAKIKRQFLQQERQQEDPVVIPVSDLLKELGLTVANPNAGFYGVRPAAETLLAGGVPVHRVIAGQLNYYIFWKYHRLRAKAVIQKSYSH